MNKIFRGNPLLSLFLIIMVCAAIGAVIIFPLLEFKLFLDLFDSFMFPGDPKNLTSSDARFQIDLYNAHHYPNDIYHWEYRLLDKEDHSREELFRCWTENKHEIIKWSDDEHFIIKVVEPSGYEKEIEVPMGVTPQEALDLLKCKSEDESYNPNTQ
jgi:hypothetical protein